MCRGPLQQVTALTVEHENCSLEDVHLQISIDKSRPEPDAGKVPGTRSYAAGSCGCFARAWTADGSYPQYILSPALYWPRRRDGGAIRSQPTSGVQVRGCPLAERAPGSTTTDSRAATEAPISNQSLRFPLLYRVISGTGQTAGDGIIIRENLAVGAGQEPLGYGTAHSSPSGSEPSRSRRSKGRSSRPPSYPTGSARGPSSGDRGRSPLGRLIELDVVAVQPGLRFRLGQLLGEHRHQQVTEHAADRAGGDAP